MTTRGAAIALAKRGLRVFRLAAGTRDRFVDRQWTETATSDVWAAAELWTWPDGSSADYNIGVLCSGLVALDVDVKKGKRGLEELAALGELPTTYTQETPSGGRHIVFDAGGKAYGQAGLSPGIDVRAYHGYVLGAGSIVGGVPYTVLSDAPVAPLPSGIADALILAARKHAEAGATVGETDTPSALARAREYIEGHAPEAEDGNRDNTAFKVAAQLYDLGLSSDSAREWLERWNDDKCHPELGPRDIDRIVWSAGTNRQNAVGGGSPEAGFEAVPDDLLEDVDDFEARVTRFAMTRDSIAAIPARPWIVHKKLCREQVTLLIGAGGMGKGLLTNLWAASVALGRNDLCEMDVREKCNVLIVNNEDPREELERRFAAMAVHHDLPLADLNGRIHYFSGVEKEAKILVRDPKLGLREPRVLALIERYIIKHRIGVVVFDPFVRFHDANENDNGEMQKASSALTRLAVRTRAAILLVHHTNKPPIASGESYAGNINAGRGASAVAFASRIGYTLFGMSERDGEALQVPAARRHRFARLDDGKANMHEKIVGAEWFERVSVTLEGSGEPVGTMRRVHFDDKRESDARTAAVFLLPSLLVDPEPMRLHSAAKLLANDPAFSGLTPEALERRLVVAFELVGSVEIGDSVVCFEATAKGRGGALVAKRRTENALL